MNLLTSDTLHLSRLTIEVGDTLGNKSAINCTLDLPIGRGLPERIAGLVRDSLAANTRRAYASDLARYENWGGAIPASEAMISDYLADHYDTHSAASLVRWLTSLSKAHRALGVPDPTRSELVQSVLRGIRRRHGTPPDQAKPLLRDDLFLMLDGLGDGMKADRDRALLLIGFAGGFRRSELVGLDVADMEAVKQGIVITIRRSKTDQLGVGRKIGIPYARGRHCPVGALDNWLSCSGIDQGPLFRPINRHGHIDHRRLSGEAVSLVVKQRLAVAGVSPAHYSGHSLRSGFATSAAQAGVSSWKIREQTGHRSDAMLNRYIRDGELFLDNAAGALL
jgi:integrase